MIQTALNDATAYRMLVPKWAVAPTSEAGVGQHGGRANLFRSRLAPGGTNLVLYVDGEHCFPVCAFVRSASDPHAG
jgi:hypothetical protein